VPPFLRHKNNVGVCALETRLRTAPVASGDRLEVNALYLETRPRLAGAHVVGNELCKLISISVHGIACA
jgi:hypothetical protein